MAAPAPTDFRQHLEVETPEHVVLDLEIAGLGSRALAALLDSLLLTVLEIGASVALDALRPAGALGRGLVTALYILLSFAIAVGYYALFEGLRQGQTPGKRRLGIRVVRDTGHGITLGTAIARNLLRLADFLPFGYLLGGLFVALHPRAKRLGDLVAGTIVVRDRPMEARPGAPPAPRPDELAAPELGDEEFQLLERFLARVGALAAPTRARLAAGLVARLAARYPVRPADDVQFLAELHAAEAGRRAGRAARGATAGRFAARKRARWAEFRALADRAAREGLDRFSASDLPDFAARYREVAADLARARTYRADAATQQELERLVAAGHNALYRDDHRPLRDALAVVARACPAAVLAAWRYVLVAFVAFAVPAAAGYAVLRERPALAEELLPEVMLRRAEAGLDGQARGQRYYTARPAERPAVAAAIMTNNIRVSFMCFAGGILLGAGSLLALAYNGLVLGLAFGHYANVGLGLFLFEFIVGHGVLELFAIWVAGGAGLLLGRAVIAPGRLPRGEALAVAGRRAVRMLGVVVVLLVVAGLIEGLLSAGERGLGFRLAVSGTSLVFLVAYLANGAARRPSSAAG